MVLSTEIIGNFENSEEEELMKPGQYGDCD